MFDFGAAQFNFMRVWLENMERAVSEKNIFLSGTSRFKKIH
jgi:hypothetical protein